MTKAQHSQLYKDRLMFLHVKEVVEREERYDMRDLYERKTLDWIPDKQEKKKVGLFHLILSNF